VGGIQSLFYGTESGRRNATWEPAFYLQRELTKNSDAFVEYAADYSRSGDARQVIHLGTAYRFTQKQQIDFHFGFGLSRAAPTHFFAARDIPFASIDCLAPSGSEDTAGQSLRLVRQ